MKVPWDNLDGPAKALVISVAFLLVAAGLCGVQALIISGAGESAQFVAPIFMITGIIELVVGLVAAITAAASLLVWISTAIYDRLTGSNDTSDETQRLFNDSDKDD